MSFVILATFDLPQSAHLALGFLRAEGIAAHIQNEFIAWDAGALGGAECRAELCVHENDAARAHALLEACRLRNDIVVPEGGFGDDVPGD